MSTEVELWECRRCNATQPLPEHVRRNQLQRWRFTLRCPACNAVHSFLRGEIKLRVNRFPERKRRPDGTYGCRGCGGDIPKGRRTWCGDPCKQKHDPYHVKHAVAVRDKAKCRLCGCECRVPWAAWSELGGTWEQFRERRVAPGEYDHIVPFSEGGPSTADNMRLLCRACHVRVTKEWRARKGNLQMKVEP